MSIGTKLAIQRTDDQTTIAMSWLERWTQQGGRAYEPDTVISRLSELLADKEKGLKFFYGNGDARWEILHELFHVADGDSAAWAGQARSQLAGPSSAPVRTVVDISAARNDRETSERLYEAIRREVLSRPSLLPVAIVHTGQQYDVMPRSFDQHEDNVRDERVASKDDGQERTRALATGNVLVIGPHQLVPLKRWVALDMRTGEMEPVGGALQFAETETLPEPLPVQHTLADLIVVPFGLPPCPISELEIAASERPPLLPTERRRMMVALADPAQAETVGLPLERFALAKALNVAATSTADERAEGGMYRWSSVLDAEYSCATAEELDATLARAQRRSVAETLLRVGQQLHLINPTTPVEGGDEYLVVHDIRPEPTPYQRIVDLTSHWTEDDAQNDPYLEKALASLEGAGADRLELEHARLTWLLGSPTVGAPRADGDWHEGLTEILKRPCPQARLRLLDSDVKRMQTTTGESIKDITLKIHPENRSIPSHGLSMPSTRLMTERTPPPYVHTLAQQTGVRFVPRLTQITVHRQQPIHIHSARAGDNDIQPQRPWVLAIERRRGAYLTQGETRQRHGIYVDERRQNIPEVFIPTRSTCNDPHSVWLDAIDASIGFGASKESTIAFAQSGNSRLAHPGAQPNTELLPVELYVPWPEIDRSVGVVWMTLRIALKRGVYEVMPDGSVLLPLRGSQLCQVVVRPSSDTDTYALTDTQQNVLQVAGSGWRADLHFFTDSLAPLLDQAAQGAQ